MRFKTAVQLIVAEWADAREHNEPVDTPPLFLGKPGIGKTSVGESAALAMTAIVQGENPGAPPALFDLLALEAAAVVGKSSELELPQLQAEALQLVIDIADLARLEPVNRVELVELLTV